MFDKEKTDKFLTILLQQYRGDVYISYDGDVFGIYWWEPRCRDLEQLYMFETLEELYEYMDKYIAKHSKPIRHIRRKT